MENKSKFLSSEEQKELVLRWKAGNTRAGSVLFEQYKTFVDIRAKKKAEKFPNTSADELRGAAVYGFFMGLMRYKPEKGAISTCVEWSIMDELNTITRFNNTKRGPRSDKARKIYREVQEELKTHMEWNTPYSKIFKSVAEKLDMQPAAVRKNFEKASLRNVDIDAPVSKDKDGMSLVDTFADETIHVIESIEKKQMADKLRSVLAQLNPRYKDIVMRRFGLGETQELNGQEETLNDVSQDYGVSRQRIDQIEKKALRQLKLALEEAGVGSSDGDFSSVQKLRNPEPV